MTTLGAAILTVLAQIRKTPPSLVGLPLARDPLQAPSTDHASARSRSPRRLLRSGLRLSDTFVRVVEPRPRSERPRACAQLADKVRYLLGPSGHGKRSRGRPMRIDAPSCTPAASAKPLGAKTMMVDPC